MGLVRWPFVSPLRNGEPSEQLEDGGGSFRCKGMEREGELIPILDASIQFIYQKPDSKNINLG
jgi:hypothetical protein